MSGQVACFGFTLAEVLITLGIIGVVAALTIPALMVKHQKKVFATKVEQTYSIVSNALLSSVAENGAPSSWNFGGTVDVSDPSAVLNSPENIERLAKTYFAPYFKSIKQGKDSSGAYYIVLSNGTTLTFYTDGNTVDDIYTIDSIYIIASYNGNTKHYSDSTRDYSRHDAFMRVIINDDVTKVRFFNWGNNTRDGIINAKYGCNNSISKNKRFGCGALIQIDGWQIKDDYPW